MKLKEGMICKHFKGENLIEKNIYKILAINPEYTGTNDFPENSIVIYKPIFQEGKCFVREYDDLVSELSDEQKEKYHQNYRVEPLNSDELQQIEDENFIKEKLEYLSQKYETKKQL